MTKTDSGADRRLSPLQVAQSRILIVDDEVANLSVLKLVLEFHGYRNIECLSDSRKVLPAVERFHPDLILLDLHMPHLDGRDILRLLQNVFSHDDYVPVLVLTGDNTSGAKESVLAEGASDFLSKPLSHTEVELRVGNLLKTRWLHRQFREQNSSLEQQVRERTKLAEEITATNQRLEEAQAHLVQSEANLRHQSKLLQSILDSMGDGVIVMDEGGNVVLLNPAAEHLVGANAKETPHGLWSEHHGIYLPGTNTYYPANQLPLSRAMRGESVDGVELFIRKSTEVPGAYMSVNVRPLKKEDGEGSGGVAVVRDITAAKESEDLLRRAKEEAERANRAKSEFLSRMSHELRTPLNSILGFAQLLQLADLPERHLDNAEHILKGGYHLLDLINEILDLARIEAGKLSMSSEPVPVTEVFKEALDLLVPVARQQNVLLETSSGSQENYHVQADRQRLKQVFLNLLANAIKFNREGGRVWISCAVFGDRLRVEVRDTGRGISEEGLRKVFTPFERLEADEAGIGGTGLGLALSKRLVEAMGGTISVTSVVGEGSTFTVELALLANPLDNYAQDDLGTSEETDPAHAIRGTILYIEDNLPNLRLMEKILDRYPGVKLLAAMHAKLGLELASAHQPDWILLDVHLPDLLGDEVLRYLQSDSRTKDIPVTVVSADATSTQIRRLMEAGARDYLTKPLDVKQILSLLEATLDRAPKLVG